MDILGNFKWFFDNRIKVSHRVGMALVILVLAYGVNDILGFSYYHRISNKTEQIEKLNTILADTTVSSNFKLQVDSLRKDVIAHRPHTLQALDYLAIQFKEDSTQFVATTRIDTVYGRIFKDTLLYFDTIQVVDTIFLTKTHPIDTTSQTPNIIAEEQTAVEARRNSTWHFISSAWILIILMVLALVGVFYEKEDSFLVNIGNIILAEIIFFTIGWILAKGYSYIPILWSPIINYLLNAVLTFILLIIFIVIAGSFIEEKDKNGKNNDDASKSL